MRDALLGDPGQLEWLHNATRELQAGSVPDSAG